MTSPEIAQVSSKDSPTVFAALAALHAEQISGGFLTSLGTPLLAQLYRAIASSPDAFIVVARIEGSIAGFLCASVDTRRVYRHVLRRAGLRLIPKLAGRLFQWRTVVRCWETLRYPSKSGPSDLPSAEILNFCVTQKVQRSGIGRKLFSAMEAEFARRGIGEIRIVTGATQHSAIEFYRKIGATPAGAIEVHAHSESKLFRYRIQHCQAPATRKP